MNEFAPLWSLFKPLVEAHQSYKSKIGRPRKPDEDIFYGVMWLTRCGARWQDLPIEYGNHKTAHRRYQEWIRAGLIDALYGIVLGLAQEKGIVDINEGFIDATFAPAKKGRHRGTHKKGKRQQNHGHLRCKRPAHFRVANQRNTSRIDVS